MRWILHLMLGVGIGAGAMAQDEPVRADPVDPTVRPVQVRPVVATSRVNVLPFEMKSKDIPQWLGRSFQSSIEAELRSVAGVQLLASSATQPSAAPDYLITGECTGTEFVLEVNLNVVHGGSLAVVHSVRVSGQTTDLLQIKSSLRQQVRELFSPSAIPANNPAPAVVMPAQRAVPAGPIGVLSPGWEFEGSDLEWAIDNPDSFSQSLDYHRNRATRTQRFGYDPYGFVPLGGIFVIGPIYRWP